MPTKVPAYDAANPYSVLFPAAASVVLPLVPLGMIAQNTIYPRP